MVHNAKKSKTFKKGRMSYTKRSGREGMKNINRKKTKGMASPRIHLPSLRPLVIIGHAIAPFPSIAYAAIDNIVNPILFFNLCIYICSSRVCTDYGDATTSPSDRCDENDQSSGSLSTDQNSNSNAKRKQRRYRSSPLIVI